MSKQHNYVRPFTDSKIVTVKLSEIKGMDDPNGYSFPDEYKQLEFSFGLGHSTRPILNQNNEVVSGLLVLQNLQRRGVEEVEVDIRTYAPPEAEKLDRLLSNTHRHTTAYSAFILASQAKEVIEGEVGKKFVASIIASQPQKKNWQTRDFVSALLPFGPRTTGKALKIAEHIQSLRDEGKTDEVNAFIKLSQTNSVHGMWQYLMDHEKEAKKPTQPRLNKKAKLPEKEEGSESDETGSSSADSTDNSDPVSSESQSDQQKLVVDQQYQKSARNWVYNIEAALNQNDQVSLRQTLDSLVTRPETKRLIDQALGQEITNAKKSGDIKDLKIVTLKTAWKYLVSIINFTSQEDKQ